jgi:hypothetical protein
MKTGANFSLQIVAMAVFIAVCNMDKIGLEQKVEHALAEARARAESLDFRTSYEKALAAALSFGESDGSGDSETAWDSTKPREKVIEKAIEIINPDFKEEVDPEAERQKKIKIEALLRKAEVTRLKLVKVHQDAKERRPGPTISHLDKEPEVAKTQPSLAKAVKEVVEDKDSITQGELDEIRRYNAAMKIRNERIRKANEEYELQQAVQKKRLGKRFAIEDAILEAYKLTSKTERKQMYKELRKEVSDLVQEDGESRSVLQWSIGVYQKLRPLKQ